MQCGGDKNNGVSKLKCHFSAIFSLFGAISTHILIGAHQHSAILFHQLDLWVALDA